QRFPNLFGRGRDVDRVNDGWPEGSHINHASTPLISSALNGISNAWPISSIDLRLDRMAGHPFEMPSRTTLSGAKSSWVRVSLISLPYGSSTNVTRDGRSLRAVSLRM